MKTAPIEQAVEPTNATKVFTYGGLGAEHRAAREHLFRAFISQAIYFMLLRYASVNTRMRMRIYGYAFFIRKCVNTGRLVKAA